MATSHHGWIAWIQQVPGWPHYKVSMWHLILDDAESAVCGRVPRTWARVWPQGERDDIVLSRRQPPPLEHRGRVCCLQCLKKWRRLKEAGDG